MESSDKDLGMGGSKPASSRDIISLRVRYMVDDPPTWDGIWGGYNIG